MASYQFPVRSHRSKSHSEQGASRPAFKLLPILLFGAFALYYVLFNRETVPVTGRTQLVGMSKDQETALGLASYQEVLQNSQIVSSGKEVEMMRRVGSKIVAALDGETSYDWEFNLVNSPQRNAFALPGGKVAVFSGILPIAANESGLATILSHEIAHVIARHGAERMALQNLTQAGQFAISASMSEMAPEKRQLLFAAFGIGSQIGVLLPYSRKHELEADHIGLLLLAEACYEPKEAPRLWERMRDAEESRGPTQMLSTHPTSETRIEELQNLLPKAEEIFQKHCNPSRSS